MIIGIKFTLFIIKSDFSIDNNYNIFYKRNINYFLFNASNFYLINWKIINII